MTQALACAPASRAIGADRARLIPAVGTTLRCTRRPCDRSSYDAKRSRFVIAFYAAQSVHAVSMEFFGTFMTIGGIAISLRITAGPASSRSRPSVTSRTRETANCSRTAFRARRGSSWCETSAAASRWAVGCRSISPGSTWKSIQTACSHSARRRRSSSPCSPSAEPARRRREVRFDPTNPARLAIVLEPIADEGRGDLRSLPVQARSARAGARFAERSSTRGRSWNPAGREVARLARALFVRATAPSASAGDGPGARSSVGVSARRAPRREQARRSRGGAPHASHDEAEEVRRMCGVRASSGREAARSVGDDAELNPNRRDEHGSSAFGRCPAHAAGERSGHESRLERDARHTGERLRNGTRLLRRVREQLERRFVDPRRLDFGP